MLVEPAFLIQRFYALAVLPPGSRKEFNISGKRPRLKAFDEVSARREMFWARRLAWKTVIQLFQL